MTRLARLCSGSASLCCRLLQRMPNAAEHVRRLLTCACPAVGLLHHEHRYVATHRAGALVRLHLPDHDSAMSGRCCGQPGSPKWAAAIVQVCANGSAAPTAPDDHNAEAVRAAVSSDAPWRRWCRLACRRHRRQTRRGWATGAESTYAKQRP